MGIDMHQHILIAHIDILKYQDLKATLKKLLLCKAC